MQKSTSTAFNQDSLLEEDQDLGELKRKSRSQLVLSLEDRGAKYWRLRREGIELAERENFWQALNRWKEALDLNYNAEDGNKDRVNVLEMRAQIFTQLHEWPEAVQEGIKAVELDPNSVHSRQTLGRAFLGSGQVERARREFQIAFHLKPDDLELFHEDLVWSDQLCKEKKDKDV